MPNVARDADVEWAQQTAENTWLNSDNELAAILLEARAVEAEWAMRVVDAREEYSSGNIFQARAADLRRMAQKVREGKSVVG